MEDINGIEIKIGDTVRTQQQPGGIMNPGPPEVGTVEACIDAFGTPALCIRYRKPHREFDQLILLTGQINEVTASKSRFAEDVRNARK
jgi:hypothetical protein